MPAGPGQLEIGLPGHVRHHCVVSCFPPPADNEARLGLYFIETQCCSPLTADSLLCTLGLWLFLCLARPGIPQA